MRLFYIGPTRKSWDVLDIFKRAAGEHGVELQEHFNNSNKQSVGYFQGEGDKHAYMHKPTI